MSYSILTIDNFKKEFKKLAKKYPSLKNDLKLIIDELELNPLLGVQISQNCRKIRMSIASKGKGKSGGARIITLIFVASEKIYLLSIFDKSDKENLSDKEIQLLINSLLD